MANIFGKYLSNFYFFNVDTSCNMHDPNLKLDMCIKNIVIKGTVSQILIVILVNFVYKIWKKIFNKKKKKLPVF